MAPPFRTNSFSKSLLEPHFDIEDLGIPSDKRTAMNCHFHESFTGNWTVVVEAMQDLEF